MPSCSADASASVSLQLAHWKGVFRRRHAPSQGAMHMADRKNTVTMGLCCSCPMNQRGEELCSSGLGVKAPSHLAGLGLENAWWPIPCIHPAARFDMPL